MERSYLLSTSEEDLKNLFKPHSDIGEISKFSSGFLRVNCLQDPEPVDDAFQGQIQGPTIYIGNLTLYEKRLKVLDFSQKNLKSLESNNDLSDDDKNKQIEILKNDIARLKQLIGIPS